MLPQVVVPAFVIGWIAATVLGGGSLVWLMWRAGLSGAQILIVLSAVVASLFVGSKLLYLVETWPSWMANRGALASAVLSPQLRIPGGFLVAIGMGPLLWRLMGVRHLWGADTVVPAAGLAVCGVRIGCFLQGCCFGTPSALPWAVTFPQWTEVYWWQVTHGVISPDAAATVPVHPLQLYFAMVGLLLFAGLAAYQRHVRYDGELLLLFLFFYLWSTWLLEQLRAEPHDFVRHLVLMASVAVSGLAAIIEWRLRAQRRRPSISSGVDRPGAARGLTFSSAPNDGPR